MQALGVPILPRIAHRLAMATAQISIGDPVIVHAGVYMLHGQIVMDGLVEVHAGVTIGPWVTIGLRKGVEGPTIEAKARIGTGAKLLGAIRVGRAPRSAPTPSSSTTCPPAAPWSVSQPASSPSRPPLSRASGGEFAGRLSAWSRRRRCGRTVPQHRGALRGSLDRLGRAEQAPAG